VLSQRSKILSYLQEQDTRRKFIAFKGYHPTLMEASEDLSTGDPTTRPNSGGDLNPSRNRRNARDRASRTADARSNMGASQRAPRRRYKQAKPAEGSPPAAGPLAAGPSVPPVTVSEGSSQPPSRKPSRNPPRPPNTVDTKGPSTFTQTISDNDRKIRDRPRPGGEGFKRGRKFNAGLTESDSAAPTVPKPAEKYKSKCKPPQAPETPDDLTSRLTYALRTPPYPDCPICFSPIHPTQPIWSCSPSIPVIRPDDAGSDEQQYCWTTFHVKCIGSWATKSVKSIADAWRARGEEDRRGDWRCPGCQAKREVVPSGYWCVHFPDFGIHSPAYPRIQVFLQLDSRT
jgi:transcriptional repressor NF-X1